MVEQLFRALKSKGEEWITEVSNQILANPAFVEVLRKGMELGELVEKQVAVALKKMNVATRKDISKLEERIAALEAELEGLKPPPKKRSAAR